MARRLVPGRRGLVLRDRHERLLLHAGQPVLDRVLPGVPARASAGWGTSWATCSSPARCSGVLCGPRGRAALRRVGLGAAAASVRGAWRSPSSCSTRTRSSSTAPCTPTPCSCCAPSVRSSCSSAGGTSPRGSSERSRRRAGRWGSRSRSAWWSARSSCSRRTAGRARPAGQPTASRAGWREVHRCGAGRPPAPARGPRLGPRDRRLVRLPRPDVRAPPGVDRDRVLSGVGPGRRAPHLVQAHVRGDAAARPVGHGGTADAPGRGVPVRRAAGASRLAPLRLGLHRVHRGRAAHPAAGHQGLHGHRPVRARRVPGDGGGGRLSRRAAAPLDQRRGARRPAASLLLVLTYFYGRSVEVS